ncbi:hypothetical protein T439DRAFT_322276 [Meredithblackwellia eburnea MCA 4105]
MFSSVPLPVLLFSVTLIVEVLGWIGNERLASAIYTILHPFSASPHAKQQRQLKRDILQLRVDLKNTSAQDEFASWAKIRRKLDKAVQELENLNAQKSLSLQSFTTTFGRLLWIITTVLPFILSSWHRKEAVFYLPAGWFGSLGWWASLPSAPAGGIACGVWTMACKRTINTIKDAVVDLCAKEIPIATEGAAEPKDASGISSKAKDEL